MAAGTDTRPSPGRRALVGLIASAALAGALLAQAPAAAFADDTVGSPTPSVSASSKPAPSRATPSKAASVNSAPPRVTPMPTASASTGAKAGSTPTPAPSASTSTSAASAAAAAAAESARIAAQIVALQQQAEQKGEVAQKAGERANDATATADAARVASALAATAATEAEQQAVTAKARASVVASRLARTDLSTLPLSLLLNGQSAGGVLGGLSNAAQLSEQSHYLYDQALAGQAKAERLQAVAVQRSADALATAKAAAVAFAAAKADSALAEQQVAAARSRQSALVAQLLATNHGADVCASLAAAPVNVCQPTSVADPADHSVGGRVVAFALAQIGKPYIFAAAGPNAYDCSGLTLAAYASTGISIGIHSATAQYRLAAAQGDLVALAGAQPGDLLFYTDGGGDMYHITIYAGNGLMIEAPYPGASVREVPVRHGDLVSQVAHFD